MMGCAVNFARNSVTDFVHRKVVANSTEQIISVLRISSGLRAETMKNVKGSFNLCDWLLSLDYCQMLELFSLLGIKKFWHDVLSKKFQPDKWIRPRKAKEKMVCISQRA